MRELTWLEWLIIGGLGRRSKISRFCNFVSFEPLKVCASLSIGIWNKKRGHVTGKTSSSLLELSISTVVTFSSSIAMLGVPGTVQDVGFRYGLICLSYPVFTMILVKYVIPEYRKCEINSVFDYIDMKFDKRVKLLALVIYNVQTLGKALTWS